MAKMTKRQRSNLPSFTVKRRRGSIPARWPSCTRLHRRNKHWGLQGCFEDSEPGFGISRLILRKYEKVWVVYCRWYVGYCTNSFVQVRSLIEAFLPSWMLTSLQLLYYFGMRWLSLSCSHESCFSYDVPFSALGMSFHHYWYRSIFHHLLIFVNWIT